MCTVIQVLSENDQPHPSNILVPDKTKIKELVASEDGEDDGQTRLTLGDLIIPNEHGFDAKTRTVLCPVTSKENTKCKKT